MADLFFADLVRESSQATGTGALTLGGAAPGCRRFSDTVPAGARFHYAVAGVTHVDQWETGEGTLDPAGALVRSPIASSAGGGAVDFLPGTKTVTLTVGAGWFAEQQARETGIADVAGLEAALDSKAALSGAVFAGPISAPGVSLGAALALEHGGTGAASAEAARAGLGLAIGADVAAFGHGHSVAEIAGLQAALDSKQPADSELTALAALASAADRLPYFTGAAAAGLTPLTSFGRSLIDDEDAGAARTTIGLGNVENKSSAAIRGELIGGNVTAALGYTPANKAGEAFGGSVSVSGALSSSGVLTLTGDNAFPGVTSTSGRIYRSANLGVVIYGAGTSFDLLLCNKTGATVLSVATGTTNAAFAGAVSVGGSQVLAARRTGWTAATGTASRGTFDTATATTAQLAERMKALIDDLAAHGLIGS